MTPSYDAFKRLTLDGDGNPHPEMHPMVVLLESIARRTPSVRSGHVAQVPIYRSELEEAVRLIEQYEIHLQERARRQSEGWA